MKHKLILTIVTFVYVFSLAADARSVLRQETKGSAQAGKSSLPGEPKEKPRAHSRRVDALAITPDGKILASSAWDKTLKIWSLPDGNLLAAQEGLPESIYCLAISPDGKTLISGSYNTGIGFWSLPAAESTKKLEREEGSAEALAVSPDGRILAAGYSASLINLWSLPEGRFASRINAGAGIRALTITPDSKILISGSFGRIELWSLPKGTALTKIGSERYFVNALIVAPEAQTLISASEDKPLISIWSLPEGNLLQELEGHADGVNALAMTPDGKVLASGSEDNTIRLWALPEGRQISVLEGHMADICALAITPDAKLLVAGDESGVVNLWDIEKQVMLSALTPKAVEARQDRPVTAAPSADREGRPKNAPAPNKQQEAKYQKSDARAEIKPTLKPYKPNEIYELGDEIALNAEGNKLSVRLLPALRGQVIVKLTITGTPQVIGFTWGQVDSSIIMVAGEKELAARIVEFGKEVVSSFDKPTLVSRFSTESEHGQVEINITDHPIIIEFNVPEELMAAPKQLKFTKLDIGETPGPCSFAINLLQ